MIEPEAVPGKNRRPTLAGAAFGRRPRGCLGSPESSAGTRLGKCREILAVVAFLFSGSTALAYIAAGDRIFPATLLLPQAAPADQVYTTVASLPVTSRRAPAATVTFGKTITDDLGIQIEDDLAWLHRGAAPQSAGGGNLVIALKYRAVLDSPHEFFFTLAVDRVFGGTGPGKLGASRQGSTMPTLYFGKGLGDFDIGYLRPLALIGMARYEVADGSRQPDRLFTGFALQYSIPYLQAKVESLELPDLLRHTTPMVEAMLATPLGTNWDVRKTAYIAPGFNYAGEGWQFGLEALFPMTRASGRGVGVMAQLYFSLDYLFAETIGRPIL